MREGWWSSNAFDNMVNRSNVYNFTHVYGSILYCKRVCGVRNALTAVTVWPRLVSTVFTLDMYVYIVWCEWRVKKSVHPYVHNSASRSRLKCVKCKNYRITGLVRAQEIRLAVSLFRNRLRLSTLPH